MKLKFWHVVLLILLAAGAQPASSAYWQWSKTPASNASADPSINWAEGMSPSSVNDSARAMMARSAEQRDDVSGLLVTSGSSTAYTVTTNQGLCPTPATAPTNGQLLTVTVNAVNGTSPTFAPDTCTAAPIQSSPGVAVPSATLIQGSPYTLKYDSGNVAWMLNGFYGSALTVPLGGMIDYTLSTVPNSNFVFPAGQCLSTITYATYWAALGSPASGSCSGGQFQIIDASGRVTAGLDTMPGFSAKNRLTSSGTGCGTAMTVVGAACSNGLEGRPINLANLPTGMNVSVGGTVTISTDSLLHGGTGGGSLQSGGALPGPTSPAGVLYGATSYSQFNSMTGVITNVSGTSFPGVPPIVGVTKLLRVL